MGCCYVVILTPKPFQGLSGAIMAVSELSGPIAARVMPWI
jgi:hypothetical protein